MDAFRNILTERIGLKDHHVDRLFSLMTVRNYRRKELLIDEGETCDFIGFISSGLMRSFVMRNGKGYNTDFYFDNYFVSAYSSLVTQTPSMHAIEALVDTEVYCLSLSRYNRLVAEDFEWLKLGKYVGDFFLVRKCKREISFLKQTAAERYEDMLTAYPGIEQLVSQYHIASYLGIKPESLSRLKLLEYNGTRSEVF